MTHVLSSSGAFGFSSQTSTFSNGVGFHLPSSPIYAPAIKTVENMYNTPARPQQRRSSTVSSYPVTTQHLSSISSSSPPFRTVDVKESDMRRNLYVLGLPSDLNQDEFEELFAPYGNVEHSVIMATLDQFNRRRGFVVLSTHQEACVAIRALSGIQLHGSQLHVSFAVIQRSEGFLDGGDRTRRARTTRMPEGRHGSSSPDMPSLHSLSSPDRSASSPTRPLAHGSTLSASTQPSTSPLFPQPQPAGGTLIALNLCPSVFPSAAALHHFFARFGRVRAVRLARGGSAGGGGSLGLGGVDSHEMPGTGVVAFESAHDASCAIEMLDGVPIGSHILRTMDVLL